MKALKAIGLTILTLILFLSLCVFGIAYTVNQTALNSRLALKTLNSIDFSQAVKESIDKQNNDSDISPELETALVSTVNSIQPVLKQSISTAINDTYGYINGKNGTPDLKQVLSDSVMNPQFVSDLLDNIDLSTLLDQGLKQTNSNNTFNDIFKTALIASVKATQPDIKKQISAASDPLIKYLLGQTSSFDLKSTLRQTVFSEGLISEVLTNLDYTALTKEIIIEQIGTQLPEGVQLSSQQLDIIAAALQPVLKTDFANQSAGIADYVTGSKTDYTVHVSLASALPTLKTVVKAAFMAQLPADIRGLPQNEIDLAFEQYYADYSQSIPTEYNFSLGNLDTSVSANINQNLADVQSNIDDARNNIDSASRDYANNLQDAKKYVKLFHAAFLGLIALIIVLIACIILIYRNVKGACLHLGIVSFIYGAITFVVTVIIMAIGLTRIATMDRPEWLNHIPENLLRDVISPWRMIGIAAVILGIILIVVSIIYPRLKPAKSAETAKTEN
jgi:hypothetical protein